MKSDSDTHNKKIGVVLVNWNSSEYTIPCVESLRAGVVSPDIIVVVDNASADDSVKLIREKFPDLLIVENDKNYGFTGGNNIGIKILLKENVDYIWVLNNDTEVDSDCLYCLVKAFILDGVSAVATGKIYFSKPNNLLWCCGSGIGKYNFKSYHRGHGEEDHGQYDKQERVNLFDGCCALIDAAILERVGLFDEHFFAYHEDIDFSFRLQQLGYVIQYAPKAVLWHKVGSSIRKNRSQSHGGTSTPLQYFLSQRNRIYILRRYGNLLQKLIGILSIVGYAICLSFVLALLLRFKKIHAAWKGIYRGLVDNIVNIKTSLSTAPYK